MRGEVVYLLVHQRGPRRWVVLYPGLSRGDARGLSWRFNGVSRGEVIIGPRKLGAFARAARERNLHVLSLSLSLRSLSFRVSRSIEEFNLRRTATACAFFLPSIPSLLFHPSLYLSVINRRPLDFPARRPSAGDTDCR